MYKSQKFMQIVPTRCALRCLFEKTAQGAATFRLTFLPTSGFFVCALVYSLGQRALRQALERFKQTIDNQLGKPTATPTLRWVFQCLMSIHLVTVAQSQQITNLTAERRWILQFFGAPCRKYYLLC